MTHSNQLKFRKYQKGRAKGTNTTSQVHFGEFGLKCLQSCRITEKQLQAAEVAIKRHVKKMGKLWFRVFCDLPVTSKPIEVRMGKGKGSVDYWACRVQKGKLLIELSGVSYELAKKAFSSGASKLPIATVMVSKPKPKQNHLLHS
uniref:Ribosomal protein L16 n=1 Tax=Jakoba libera TaxID=143017 RepID=M4QL81_JAKLI|nr:ribosomal protein L16 [Jakoba libera]AGH24208.1 ribosomal protein L16 [Jakoba libera]